MTEKLFTGTLNKNQNKTKQNIVVFVVARQQKVFQSDPESYNGARRENYRWAQSITDLDFRINVSETE